MGPPRIVREKEITSLDCHTACKVEITMRFLIDATGLFFRVTLLVGIEMSFWGVSRFFIFFSVLRSFWPPSYRISRPKNTHGLTSGRRRSRCRRTVNAESRCQKGISIPKTDLSQLDTTKKTSRYQKFSGSELAYRSFQNDYRQTFVLRAFNAIADTE